MLFPGDKISMSEAVKELSLKGYEVSTSQIRKLHNQGYIELDREGKNERREISAKSLEHLEIILALRLLGIPLKNIKKILEMYKLFQTIGDMMEDAPSLPYVLDEMLGMDQRELDGKEEPYKQAVAEVNRMLELHIQNVKKVGQLLEEKMELFQRE